MAFTTYYLKFPDEAAAHQVLQPLGLYQAATEEAPAAYITAGDGWALDPVGIITLPADYDPNTGQQTAPAQLLDGWHANFLAKQLPPQLAPFALAEAPSKPFRRFAGF